MTGRKRGWKEGGRSGSVSEEAVCFTHARIHARIHAHASARQEGMGICIVPSQIT